MTKVDEVIIAVTYGEFSEVEFWRRLPHKQMTYRTYTATSKNVGRLLGVLANTKLYHKHMRFGGPNGCTMHFEV